MNKLRGIIKVCAIKAPGFGERRKALLQDIAIVTGAEFIAKDLGMRIEETQIEQLGTARKVTHSFPPRVFELHFHGWCLHLQIVCGFSAVCDHAASLFNRHARSIHVMSVLPTVPDMFLQVTIRPTECTLIADAANKEEIDLRVQQIKQELRETDSTYDTEKLSERIAKLAGGVAVIKVSPSSHCQHRLWPNIAVSGQNIWKVTLPSLGL